MAARRERKSRRQQQRVLVNDASGNRIRPVMEELMAIEDPDDLMIQITNILSETDPFPQVGKIYVYMYFAKTPGIVYDLHPLTLITSVMEWGFKGYNFHWDTNRNYTWQEVFSPFHIVRREELRDLQAIPFQKFRLNS